MISYVCIPIVPWLQERSEAERRATTGPGDGFDEGRPGGAQSGREGGKRSHTAIFTLSIFMQTFSAGVGLIPRDEQVFITKVNETKGSPLLTFWHCADFFIQKNFHVIEGYPLHSSKCFHWKKCFASLKTGYLAL